MGDTTLKIHVDVTDALNGTAKLGTGIENLNAEAQKFGTRSKQAFMSTKDAAKALNQGVDKLEGNLKLLTAEYVRLGQIGSKMNKEEVLRWKKLNNEIENTKNQITLLKGKQADLGVTTTKTTGLFTKLAGVMAGAFSVYAIINFSKVAVKAYQEQLRSEAKLVSALKGRGRASEMLIKQANELQTITLFDDEQIINAQALLAISIKDEDQIKKLIPLVLDLAQAKGMDLASAAQAVNMATMGQGRALKSLGIELDLTGTKTQNLTLIMDALNKTVGGQSQDALSDSEKQLRKYNVAINELKESWGKLILGLSETGVFSDVNTALDLTKVSIEQIGKTKGWEKFSEILGFLTGGTVLNQQYYVDLADSWERIAKGADAWADALERARGNQPNFVTPGAGGGYPEPMATDDGRRNYEYDTTQYLIKLREGLVDKYGNLLDEQNKDLLKALDDELKYREEQAKKLDEINKEKARKEQEWIDIKSKWNQEEVERDAAIYDQQLQNQEDYMQMKADRYAEEADADAAKYDAELKALAEFNEKVKKELEAAAKWAEDNPFWASLGFTDQKQLDQMSDYADEMLSFITEIVDQSVEASERLVDDWNQRIDEQQALVEREQEDKAEGLANNYALEQENLANMQKARDQAIKDREKNIQIQRTLSTIESGIALVTAAANIMKGFSEIPIVGVILGLLAVGAMITGFILAQSQIADATKMEKGGLAHGLLKGKRHSEGGIAIEAEEGEYFTNRNSTKKYLPLLEAINKDDREGMKLFFDRKFVNKMPQQKLSFDIDSSKKLEEIARNTRNKKGEIFYGDGFIIERNGGYTKKINLN